MESQHAENPFPLGSTPTSPDAVRLSLAAAMTLGLKSGRFYRDAQLRCINLLQTYPSGCVGRCSYCGLSRNRIATAEGAEKGGSRSFIRVSWPTYHLDEIIERFRVYGDRYDRICLSMVTHKGALDDLVEMTQRIRERVPTPLSALLTPTVTTKEGLASLREAGIDRIGIAVDAATPELFEYHRGSGQGPGKGPHRWDRYWQGLEEGVDIFGPFMVGCHLIVGLGETEEQMVKTFGRVHDLQCVTHLFSFFPELGSTLEARELPSMGRYRRMQLARYLIDERLAKSSDMSFDHEGRLLDFGLNEETLEKTVSVGEPFRTSGCPGLGGEVACNRPFANSRPGPNIRNFPFRPEPADIEKIRRELWS